jgi:hypothetical protein
MTFRPVFVVLALSLMSAGTAMAASDVVPKPGIELSGAIKFPREQRMTIATDPQDSSRLKVHMGFDGLCNGGALQEAWASMIEAKPTVRVRDGRFSAGLTGTARDLGGVKGRTGEFTWKLSGRFLAEDVVSATVSGTAAVKKGQRVIARCKIAEPTAVRLAVRSPS